MVLFIYQCLIPTKLIQLRKLILRHKFMEKVQIFFLLNLIFSLIFQLIKQLIKIRTVIRN